MVNTMHMFPETINKLIKKINNIKNILQYDKKKKRIIEIKNILHSISLQENKKNIKKIKQEKSKIKKILTEIKSCSINIQNINQLIQLSIQLQDTSVVQDINLEIKKIKKQLKKIEIYNLLKKKYDYCNCYLDIQSGSGGIDAQDWSKILLRMYLKWTDKKGFKTEIIQKTPGETAGIKYATIKIIGKYAFGWLRTETGIHRLIRKSPFNSGNRRHTSFSSVFVYPEINNKIKIKIQPSDLRIDVYRASGCGGQHVNRTESAVRITHIPTSTVTQCQNERSQHQNKEQAMKQMKLKLYKIEMQKKNDIKQHIENTKSTIGWGNQIRSYVLDNSRVKDLRTGIESRNIQSVLNGNLDSFIEKSLQIGL
ncbi:Peptide chain release factor RF2 [Buchnera aphidicola (Pterocallis alni)]|uniref:peptide chain release factor 2 n=1 Tax=Buchnera aphidicola TaxID=9 RepID=UPI0034647986